VKPSNQQITLDMMDDCVDDVTLIMEDSDNSWTDGLTVGVSCHSMIDEGASGTVYQVSCSSDISLIDPLDVRLPNGTGTFVLAPVTDWKGFVRKIIHVISPSMKAAIQNETRALGQLQKAGDHKNIIQVLGHGWLGVSQNYFFIDMDLCDSNLHDYIHSPNRKFPVDETYLETLKNPVYVSRNSSLLVEIRNI
jgi:serine/threonine protein kinase